MAHRLRRLLTTLGALGPALLAPHYCAAPPPPPLPPQPAAHRHYSLAELDEMHEDAGAHARAHVLEAAEYLLERSDAPQVHWRVGRALHQCATLPATPPAQRLQLLERAYAEVTAAKAELPQDSLERGAVYRWSGIILSDLSALQGTRQAILAAYAIHSDFEEALELDPQDASAHHLMGQWALRVATLGPWTRWLASTLYAEPPSASLEEAREAFERAEELQPGFWVANQALLAKTLAAMGETQGARQWAERACALPVVTEDDKVHHAAAAALLASLPKPQ